MRNQRLLAVVLAVLLGSVSVGQGQVSSSSQKPAEGDVVRITTNLVQVDAVITDKNGKLVTDLKPEELQLLENNRSQKITHFSYITAGASAAPPWKATPRLEANFVLDGFTHTSPTFSSAYPKKLVNPGIA